MKRILALAMMAVTAHRAAARPASAADAAFEQLRNLAGDWEGKDEGGSVVHSSFRMVAGNTTVLETLRHADMEEMLSLYSVDGDSIALQHYCPTNNQPRMRVVPQSDDVKELSFDFQGAGNLKSSSTGHQHHLVLRFIDDNHIVEAWTWREDGKDTPMSFQFKRKKQ